MNFRPPTVLEEKETTQTNHVVLRPAKPDTLRVIPLGGLGEYGKNMMAFEYGKDIIVVDCGIMFPEEEMLGVDFVIPDSRYLEENKNRILGMIFTHGHEDHVGGVPYILPRLGNVPLYGSPLTMGLLGVKFNEFGIRGAKINVVNGGQEIKLGPFTVEFIHVTHSIPDSFILAITTPAGLLVFATDWKFDHTPISGQPTDVAKLAELSKRGVKCLFSDSSNVEVPGYTISEQVVSEAFDKVFKNAPGRVIITSFASLINRIQQVINAAAHYHRKVAISGRSMEENVKMAMELGYLKVPQGILVDVRRISHIPDGEIAILCTGSQGEQYSALSRMASGEHRQIKIKPGDTVVISASPIPGNEQSISDVVNNLYREGAQVVMGKEVDVHVSGHASQEELKMMIGILKPEYFIPIHGEYRQLYKHARLAQDLGIEGRKIFVVENGQVVEFDKEGARITRERVPAGYVLVDGLGIGDVGNIVLRDRQAMAKEGVFVVILTIDHSTGKILTSPDIISRGFVYMRAAEDLIFKARQEVKNIFARHNEKYPMNWDFVKKAIREEMGEFLFTHTQRRPMVIPVIIEV
jgi:ribonuclease J